MKIQYASDLHLEFMENSDYLIEHPLKPVGDILVLAGDIGHLDCVTYSEHPFWDWAAENFKQVLVVPGNHEFYGGYDLDHVVEGAEGVIRDNVRWYYNKSVAIGDVEIILSPLWAQVLPHAEYIIERRVNDFRRIKYKGERLTSARFNELNRESVAFLQRALAESRAGKRIVVTHHLPSMMCIAPQYIGDILNGAFASEQAEWIDGCGADYWIYGHSHCNVGEQVIGGTKLVCNQMGYVPYNEHRNFVHDKVLEI
jgi:predicted phosphodiesterase